MKYTPQMLANWLRDDIGYVCFGENYPIFPGGIVLLDGSALPVDSNCLYIGTEADVLSMLGTLDDKPIVVLCSDYSGDPHSFHCKKDTTLLAFSLSLVALYNRVQYHVHRFIAWENELRSIVYNNEKIEQLIRCASEQVPYDMCLLNTGYGMISGSFSDDCSPIFSELKDNGYLSFETVKALQKMFDMSPKTEHTEFSSLKPGFRTLVWPIRHDDKIVARYIINVPDDASLPCSLDLCRLISSYIATYLTSIHAPDYQANTDFGALVADLIENRISGEKELSERLKSVPLAFSKYYYLIIISFPNIALGSPNPPWNYIISQLQQFFITSNITTYRGKIIVLARGAENAYRPSFNETELYKLLSHYDAVMMVGSYSRFLTSLYPIYTLANEALRIACKLAPAEKRIFYFEDYSNYLNLEQSIRFLHRTYGIVNYVYLCHPAYVRLLHQDRKHGTDYCRVLKTYLRNGCNAAEAARELYLHRNTMLYKIGRIEEIAACKLDDLETNLSLLRSCYIDEYITRYLGEDILKLKQNDPAKEK